MSLPASEPPLVIDLDGSLLRSDSLHEAFARMLRRRPHLCLALPVWLLSGRAHLKARLTAAVGGVPAQDLPYRRDIVAWLEEERRRGRRIVLATAADSTVANAVADHLGLFDEVLSSRDGVNLKGEAKRRELVTRFGERGFDYAGNGAADLPAWRSARRAYVLGGSPSLAKETGAESTELRLPPASSRLMALARALRVHHWSKNALVFVPLLTAHRVFDPASQVEALLAFLAFSLAASAAYLVNDMADLEADRQHPAKRDRALASGDLSLAAAFVLAPLLVLAAAGVAATLGPRFLAVLLAYFAGSIAYTLAFKRFPILDVIVLAALYTVRIIAGAIAIDVMLSHWLLTFSMFVFLSLALAKRHAELSRVGPGDGARGYRAADLPAVAMIGLSSAMVSLVVLALYISSGDVFALYRNPQWLWFLVPALLYWLARAWLLALRGELSEDPILFALHDPASYATALVCLAAVVASI